MTVGSRAQDASGDLRPARVGFQHRRTVGGTTVITACELGFTVNDVPDGLTSYVLTVSHRGDRLVSSTEAHASIDLAIGN